MEERLVAEVEEEVEVVAEDLQEVQPADPRVDHSQLLHVLEVEQPGGGVEWRWRWWMMWSGVEWSGGGG